MAKHRFCSAHRDARGGPLLWPSPPQRLHGREQVSHLDAQGGSDADQIKRGHISLPPFDPAVVAAGNAGFKGEVLLGDSARLPQRPEALTHQL